MSRAGAAPARVVPSSFVRQGRHDDRPHGPVQGVGQPTSSMMLLRLSRISFWLAAIVAAAALFAPQGHETLLMAVTTIACAAAFGFWRSGIASQRRSHADVAVVTEPPPLGEASLLDAASSLVREVEAAGSFEAALHAATRVLRGELGAREAGVVQVREVEATQAQVIDLIEAQPGFHPLPRRVRLESGGALGRAIATGAAATELPAALAVPVDGAGRVVAVIELRGLELRVEPPALAGLVELARVALARRLTAPPPGVAAEAAPTIASKPLAVQGNVLLVEDNVVNPERTMRMLRRLGCQVTPASGMLEAVKWLGEREFDLVLVDLQLPGDRSFAMTAGMPMMAIVGSGAPIDTKRLHELGFDDHVCKPFQQREMQIRLSKYLPVRAPLGPQEPSGADGTPALAATAQTAAPALDPAALARLMELDPKGENHLVERVLKAFQVSVARLRPQAVTARANKDLAGLRLVAHTLKSSSASIGAMHLSQVCAQIETTIRGGDVDDIDVQIDALDAALDNALLAIDEQLKGCA